MTRAAEDLTPAERRARVSALRGLMRARDESFEAACALFAEAARLDPRLDLTSVPSFWQLPRGGQQAAIEAYELAGREREAAMLIARVRRAFRPRPLAPPNGKDPMPTT